nr:hypothetical protein TetV2_00263 [Oceanusvirus sp.]
MSALNIVACLFNPRVDLDTRDLETHSDQPYMRVSDGKAVRTFETYVDMLVDAVSLYRSYDFLVTVFVDESVPEHVKKRLEEAGASVEMSHSIFLSDRSIGVRSSMRLSILLQNPLPEAKFFVDADNIATPLMLDQIQAWVQDGSKDVLAYKPIRREEYRRRGLKTTEPKMIPMKMEDGTPRYRMEFKEYFDPSKHDHELCPDTFLSGMIGIKTGKLQRVVTEDYIEKLVSDTSEAYATNTINCGEADNGSPSDDKFGFDETMITHIIHNNIQPTTIKTIKLHNAVDELRNIKGIKMAKSAVTKTVEDFADFWNDNAFWDLHYVTATFPEKINIESFSDPVECDDRQATIIQETLKLSADKSLGGKSGNRRRLASLACAACLLTITAVSSVIQ